MTEILRVYGPMLLKAIGTHLLYVAVSVVIGSAVGLVLGILLSRIPKVSALLLPLISVFQTIPGLVFIGLLFLLTGMRPITVIIALSVYAVFPVLKNTYVGLLGVDSRYTEAAKGCGMTTFQQIMRVELPLAFPTIVAGIRMSAVYVVSWAVLASMIGLGGLGDFIYQGTTSNNNTLILLGAIPAAVIALLLGALIDRLQKKMAVRWGERRDDE